MIYLNNKLKIEKNSDQHLFVNSQTIINDENLDKWKSLRIPYLKINKDDLITSKISLSSKRINTIYEKILKSL